MTNQLLYLGLLLFAILTVAGCALAAPDTNSNFQNYTLDFTTPTDSALQTALEKIDTAARVKHNITPDQTSVGLLDLRTLRWAAIHPDHEEYGASVPKIGILLAYFQLHPQAATNLDPTIRHELGLMAKASDNDLAAKYSQQLGLKPIQQVLATYQLYDPNHGGGLWVGKHYGITGERYPDPVGDNSHAATVRQLLRYFLFLEQGKLVNPAASQTMRDIFASPDIPADQIKFVKALAGRPVQLIRKWGSWEDWLHDAAIVTGPHRHYILAALTKTPHGDPYLEDLATSVDDLMLTQP